MFGSNFCGFFATALAFLTCLSTAGARQAASQGAAHCSPASSPSVSPPPPAAPSESAAPQVPPTPAVPTRADIIRGAYGPYRANNDLLSYDLDVRVDPEKKIISGRNAIRFKMLTDATRIQLDLHSALDIDKILLGSTH